MTMPDSSTHTDAAGGEAVYAPASERVPVDPVPGHREFTDRTDTQTAERQAASYPPTMSNSAHGTYNDATWNNEIKSRAMPVGMRLGWVLLGIGGGVGGWLFLRWQRERNRPINRIRRQAMHAAGELRDRVPSSAEEAVRPAAGLTTALISIALIVYQQMQARSRQADKRVSRETRKAGKRADKAFGRASDAVSDLDLQKRLSTLKRRWNPSRLELEKISISRH
ncbi:MAG TPA: hypothetical protein VKV73_01595 [Chloroflexota bacterium]|nr:hypothetical protein [Chloroflexota bacterium]